MIFAKIVKVKPGSTAADQAPKNNLHGSSPITWNPVIGEESRKINTLEQVSVEKVEQPFRDLH
jgi:hypothetical protein